MRLDTLSPEMQQKLARYEALLGKWQRSINLVSARTLPKAPERHFADSAQLAALIDPAAQILVDLGSGAGFPGLVLAILRPDLGVHLIESDERTAQFLRTVSRETKCTNVQVHARRAEDILPGLPADVITARALAPLDKLLALCSNTARQTPDLTLIFPKGSAGPEELKAAQQKFHFEYDAIPSETLGDGVIYKITQLDPIGRA